MVNGKFYSRKQSLPMVRVNRFEGKMYLNVHNNISNPKRVSYELIFNEWLVNNGLLVKFTIKGLYVHWTHHKRTWGKKKTIKPEYVPHNYYPLFLNNGYESYHTPDVQ